jgi:uncharacterized protein YukE
MTTLDKIMQMQQAGMSDTEIMAALQNEGVQPSDINDAINQARVKNAVYPPEPQTSQSQEMQPSITETPQVPQYQNQQPEVYPQQQQAPPQEEYYTPQPQAYSGQEYYPQQEEYGTGNMTEIAEQVATEKLEDYKSKVGDIVSFKNQITTQVNNIDDRLKRIENSIDRLQQAILGKIGEYGENYSMVHQDLENLHGTVAKLMNPLIDNINEMKKYNKK